MPRGNNNKYIPTFEDRQYVLNNAWSTPYKYMAQYIGIDYRTFKKRFEHEIAASNSRIMEKATQAAEHLIEAGDYRMIEKVLAKIGKLSEDSNNTNIAIQLNNYVDKPKDLTTEQWIEYYSKNKPNKPKEIEQIEDVEVIEE